MSSVPRFFVLPSAIRGDSVILPPDAAHHAASVLRLRDGEAVTIHDGTGAGYTCRLTQVTSKSTTATIEHRFTVHTESATRITIAQALPKTGEKIEQVLQHGTEVGAAGFVLFPAERSVARIEGKEKAEKRLERWSGIVQSAAEQSGRGTLPSVRWAAHLSELVGTTFKDHASLLLHESSTAPLQEILLQNPIREAIKLLVIVGPEGGFSDREVAILTGAGAVSVSLGPRILRTETAALVALSQILFARDK